MWFKNGQICLRIRKHDNNKVDVRVSERGLFVFCGVGVPSSSTDSSTAWKHTHGYDRASVVRGADFCLCGFNGYRVSVEQRVTGITADVGRLAGRQVAKAVA
jgi:hypothetical protein